MSTSHAIAPVASVTAGLDGLDPTASVRTSGASFSQLLLNGIDHVDKLQTKADQAVQAFALDDSIPPHRVMFALEEAHGSLAMMMQVRNRLVEGYLDLMRMQL